MERMRVGDGRAQSWLAVIATVLVLSGCGGGGTAFTEASGETTSTSPVIVRADAICRRLNAELAAEPPKSVSTQEIERLSPRNAALEQGAVARLAKLHPPAALEGEWLRVLAYRHRLADALDELAQAAKAGDEASIHKLGESKERLRKELLEVGRRVGFTYCQEVV